MPKYMRALQIERKTILVERNSNQAGEFVRITESVENHGHKNAVVIPLVGVGQVADLLLEALNSQEHNVDRK